MRSAAALTFSALLVACSPAKLPDSGPEFTEDGKTDSATRPITVEPITVGDTLTARFDASAHYRAYVFAGRRGAAVDLFVDGVGHLDTVVYLYATKNGKPAGRSLVYNDDTASHDWTTNPLSSSVHFVLPSDGSYALVASTYGHRGVGTAEVRVESAASGLSDAQILVLAKAAAWPGAVDADHVRKLFDNEAAAYAWLQANMPTQSLQWLAYDGDAVHFVSGINDLWAQRFVIDRTTGAITITGEH